MRRDLHRNALNALGDPNRRAIVEILSLRRAIGAADRRSAADQPSRRLPSPPVLKGAGLVSDQAVRGAAHRATPRRGCRRGPAYFAEVWTRRSPASASSPRTRRLQPMTIEPLVVAFEVGVPPPHAFETWTRRCATWWPRSHTISGHPTTVTFEPRPGGRIVEHAPDGREHRGRDPRLGTADSPALSPAPVLRPQQSHGNRGHLQRY